MKEKVVGILGRMGPEATIDLFPGLCKRPMPKKGA